MKPERSFQIIASGFLLILASACSSALASSGEPTRVPPTAAVTEVPAQVVPTSLPASELTSTATLPPGVSCSPDALPTFMDYPSWTLVNPGPVQGHETWVNIYVNDLAESVYLSASGETFPACATIVKTHLLSETSDQVVAITVMVKMPAGFDPEHNDWWWAMYNATGTTAEMSGTVRVCIDCHQPVAEADFVFSEAVMAAANK